MPRLQGLDENSLAFLFWRAEEGTLPAGADIYTEGKDSDKGFGLLLDGELSIIKVGRLINRISKPELFGEIVYFAPQAKRTSTVEVASPTATYLLFRIDPKELIYGPFAELGSRLGRQAWQAVLQDA